MLAILDETPMSLLDVCRKLPPGKRGASVHLSCVMRWITAGVRSPQGSRIRLEAVRVGKRWVTSEEALMRFIEEMTPKFEDEAVPAIRSPAKRQRAVSHATRRLEAAGIR